MGLAKIRCRPGLILEATVVLLLAACGGDQKHAPPPPEAGYVVMEAEPVPLVTELSGRTSAYEVSEVRPQVSGVIRARQFTEGSIVQAGQTLYQIDPSLYRAAVDQARANLANAKANESSAQAKAERYRPLAQIEAVSKQDYTDARAAANRAHAAVAQNRAALETANINLHYTRVPAPITGRIGRSLITTGALVTAGQADALATIQRLDPIFVDIQQSSAELLGLRRALTQGGAVPTQAQVQLILEDGTVYGATGTLEFTEAVVDPTTGTVTLRARFPNPAGLLLPGMFVRARVTQETVTNGILVPQQGITHDGNGNATVLVVGPANKATTQIVTAPRTVGDKWLVTAGLKPGEKVIVEGLGRIKPGQKVVPVPAGSPPRARPGSGTGAGRAR
jgi:membrane fusion protein (multidrug efflux system)